MALKQSVKRLNPLFFNTIRQYSSSEKFIDTKLNEKNGITTITMQKPPVNSLNRVLLSQLLRSLRNLQGSESRGVILTSSSPKVFCAGLDILEMYKGTEKSLTELWTTMQDTWIALYGSNFPTVAAINGHAPAGGCMLSVSCEYRVMLPKFSIGLNETQLGVVAPTWFQETTRNIIGSRQTELALTTGKMFTSEEALKIGLVDELATDKDDLIARAEGFLMKFAKISPRARSESKLSFRSREIAALEKNRDQDLQIFVARVMQPEVQEGLAKYIEMLKKRSKRSQMSIV